MFGKWLSRSSSASVEPGAEQLLKVVQRELPKADEETWLVVTAMTALLGAVAYADRDYSETEEQRVRAELQRVQGMTTEGIDVICSALRARILEVATVEIPKHCRTLREIANNDLRFEILRLLIGVAAADGNINLAETTLLRQITQSLGLSQDDYVTLQQQHRDKLGILTK